jgi:hypothetical protein
MINPDIPPPTVYNHRVDDAAITELAARGDCIAKEAGPWSLDGKRLLH